MAMLSFLIFLVGILLQCTSSNALHGWHKYIEYQPGGMALILSVPHGGKMRPENIPARVAGCYVRGRCVYRTGCGQPDSRRCRVATLKDSFTLEITLKVADLIAKNNNGRRPHVIINHLHRSIMDPNRPVEEATLGNPKAFLAYEEYHGFLRLARRSFQGMGLLLDIHGQAHREQWIELGYDLSRKILNGGHLDLHTSTIRHLAAFRGDLYGEAFEEVLRGNSSLGGCMNRNGLTNVVPSPRIPRPNDGSYYNGGYTVENYGSMNGGRVDAIQIESPSRYRNQQNYTSFSNRLMKSVLCFYRGKYEVNV